ncbi:MAG: ABC-type nitrate/sulfonate/bicarbonate transport system, periplasmic component, partial [Dehalococcoidia bacterium]|nr:ABC-type nitrate/sulfonate/bicarbonate transport system, periplasmic component [Dehalococcoidia bacterium]
YGGLRLIDDVPVHVALQEGFFLQENLEVEVIDFNSALERNTALQAGRVDTGIYDILQPIFLNREGEVVKIVRAVMRPTEVRAQFPIVAGAKSGITTVEGLKNKKIAVGKNTVTEYVTHAILLANGFAPREISTIDIPNIALRLQMATEGQVDAVTLPEPLASLAVAQGGKVVADDRGGKVIGQVSSLPFSQAMIKENPDAVRRFLNAYEKAVEAFNSNPEKYRELMNRVGRVPEALQKSIQLPVFLKSGIPTNEEILAVGKWLTQQGVITEPLPYSSVVSSEYLPK